MSSSFLMEALSMFLLCMLALTSKSRIFLSLYGLFSSVSLWMSRSRRWSYLVNYRLPISFSSGLRAYVFTMSGVVPEVPEKVASLILLTSSMYSCWVTGVIGGRRLSLISISCFRKLLVWSQRDCRSKDVPRRGFWKMGLFKLYFRRSIRGAIFGRVFSDILIIFQSLSLIFFGSLFWVTYILVTCIHKGVCVDSLMVRFLTPARLWRGWRRLSWRACSLIFLVEMRACRCFSSTMLPIAAIFLALSSRWVGIFKEICFFSY